MTDVSNQLLKTWWQSKTVWAALISAVCAVLAITGHHINSDTQAQLVNEFVDIANGISIVSGIAAAYYRTKATAQINPNVKEIT